MFIVTFLFLHLKRTKRINSEVSNSNKSNNNDNSGEFKPPTPPPPPSCAMLCFLLNHYYRRDVRVLCVLIFSTITDIPKSKTLANILQILCKSFNRSHYFCPLVILFLKKKTRKQYLLI